MRARRRRRQYARTGDRPFQPVAEPSAAGLSGALPFPCVLLLKARSMPVAAETDDRWAGSEEEALEIRG
jgi:hypothetical protein